MFFGSTTEDTNQRVLEKWNSIGNDFLITQDSFTKEEIIRLCDRHFGIGADQFVKIENNKIRFFNSDGTESGMCGNALKCIATIISDLVNNVETSAYKLENIVSREANIKSTKGKFILQLKDFNVTVEIGEDKIPSIFFPPPLTFREEGNPFLHFQAHEFQGKKERFDFIKLLQNPSNSFFFVDIGNPHLVSIIDISDASYVLDTFFSSKQITEIINYAGEKIQKEFLKTGGINLSFVVVENNNNIFVRTYERGVGETLSCGSGSAVSVFITTYLGLTHSQNIRVFNKGSEKVLAIKESYHQLSVEPSNLLLKGKGTKVAKVII